MATALFQHFSRYGMEDRTEMIVAIDIWRDERDVGFGLVEKI